MAATSGKRMSPTRPSTFRPKPAPTARELAFDLVQAAARLELVQAGKHHEFHRFGRSSLHLDHEAGVVRARIEGHGHAAFVVPIVRRIEDAVALHLRFVLFEDYADMPTWDDALREGIASACLDHRAHLRAVHRLDHARSAVIPIRTPAWLSFPEDRRALDAVFEGARWSARKLARTVAKGKLRSAP